MNKLVEYKIQYEHLAVELINNEKQEWCFKQVKDYANKYRIELSDEDFERLFKLKLRDKDVGWMINKMSHYNMSLLDVLVSYIIY